MFSKRKTAARRRRRSAPREDDRVLPAMAKSVLFALLGSLLAGLLLLLIFTAVLLTTKDPDRYRPIAGMAALYLTAALGGMLASRIYGRRAPVLCGLFEGLALFLLFTVAALCVPGDGGNRALAFLLRLLVIPASLLGAWLTTKKAERRGRPRRRA